MKRLFIILFISFFCCKYANSQCSLCTRTAQQMGEKPAQGLNVGILYLMGVPFAVAGFIGYKWWVRNKN